MIRLQSLNKFFNKGRSNQIHVINNTTLDFPEVGLVALTGPSGCGKTTLLNVIGGLDSFESGEIIFYKEVIRKYQPNRWDILRNKYVGYIFQNYNLVTDKTVYENVEIALNMAGLYDKSLVEERIEYVLKSVGMYHLRKRSVLALSGGQQQRVAIARAIAKNPKVVLADEPTGNLDANNTFEIMSLIKKISKTTLVILVSHERELVEFYADRIIQLQDGRVIQDDLNEGNRSLDRMDDRNIHLKDLTKEVITGAIDVDYYYDVEGKSRPRLSVIEWNNTVYIKAEANTKIKYLTSDTDIKLIDDYYKKVETIDADQKLFDLSAFEPIPETGKRKSFIRFKDTIKSGFDKVFQGKKAFSKIFIIVYFVISSIIVFNLATLGNMFRTDEASLVFFPQNSVGLKVSNQLSITKLNEILALNSVDAISPYNSAAYMTFRFENFVQGSGPRATSTYSEAFPVSVSQLGSHTLLHGSLPINNQQIAIDKWIAQDLLREKSVIDLGITTIEQLIGGLVRSNSQIYPPLTISGIVESNSRIVVLANTNLQYFNGKQDSGIGSLETTQGLFTLTLGSQMLTSREVLVHADQFGPLGSTVTINGIVFTVAGKFTGVNLSYIVRSDDLTQISNAEVISFFNSFFDSYIVMFSSDKQEAVSQISDLTFESFDMYAKAISDYQQVRLGEVMTRLIGIIISLVGTIVFIVLSMRSSMLGRIKEIGIYRSIGATKFDITKIFLSEIIAFTTVGSLTGYVAMTFLVDRIDRLVGGLTSVFYFPLPLFLAGISFIYLVNILFGLLPIFGLLRKTPSEINAKYDI
ncbi:MAG: ABC transporter ATP-binding protein/permease [Candidatus Izemoplasmatales bacterium]|nr:ABC transporter ATP-binding protein/permease [bacterium]MDZ4196972.1 ABC transporter ATP-binding protein/permease [Candidatus Izemoplasmatales bacterium]